SKATGAACPSGTSRGTPSAPISAANRSVPPMLYPLWTDRPLTRSVSAKNARRSAGSGNPAARSSAATASADAGGSNVGRFSHSQPGRGTTWASSRRRDNDSSTTDPPPPSLRDDQPALPVRRAGEELQLALLVLAAADS